MALRRTRRTSGGGSARAIPDTDFMRTARMRFRQAGDATREQADRENNALKFYDGNQWPEDIRKARAGSSGGDGLPMIPARPCLTVNKVKAPVLRVINQERQSDIGISIVPADDFEALVGPIDDSEIELREGLIRRIQRTSEASEARSWAFQRAVIAGTGYYRVLTRYLPGKTSLQEVVVAKIFNQGSVRLDPSHEHSAGMDADWGFVGAWISLEKYLGTYKKAADDGKNALADYDNEEDFRTLTESYPDWFKVEDAPDGKSTRAVHICEYVHCKYTSRNLITAPDYQDIWEDEATPEQIASAIDTRTVPERVFTHSVIDGVQELERTEWPIPYTGIIKVLGEETQPYDGQRRAKGMVEDAIDSNQGFNAMMSKMVEVVGYAPIPPIMLAEGQDAGFEKEYAAAMTRTLPVLHYRLKDLNGDPAPPPFAPPRNAPVEAVSFALSVFGESVQDTTSTHDTALGKTERNVKSAKHANFLTEESNVGTSGFLDNLSRSMHYEGTVENALLYPIYGIRPGRIAHMLKGDGVADVKPVLVGTPFTMQGTRPVPAIAGAEGAQKFSLTKDARFNVAIKVTKSFDRLKEQQNDIVGGIIAQAPETMSVIGDLFFKSMDGPGHKEMAERFETVLAPPVQKLLESKKTGRPPLPPDVEAQMAKAQEMIQALTQHVNELGKKVQTDEVKQTHENARAQHDNDTKFEIEKMRVAADVQKARIAADLQIELQKLKMAQENLTREDMQAHEVGMAGADALEAAQQAQLQAEILAEQGMREATIGDMASDKAHAQSLEASTLGHQQSLEAGDVAHQQGLETQEQAAELAPEPEAQA